MYRVHDNVTRFFRFVCTSMNNKWIKKTNKSFETIVYYLLFIYIYIYIHVCFELKEDNTAKQTRKQRNKKSERKRKKANSN